MVYFMSHGITNCVLEVTEDIVYSICDTKDHITVKFSYISITSLGGT